ncbi:MAG: response regulator [Minisyncoccia bacterium]
MRILLVDDESFLRRLIIKALNIMGHSQIIEASSVDEAADIIQEREIHFVITDWEMPGKNGGELIRLIRQDSANRHIPVLIISGSLQIYEMEHLSQFGITDRHLLSKPFKLSELGNRIESILVQNNIPPIRS